MVQVGPQWFRWVLKWSQTVPESPRQSFKFQKKFPSFTIFRNPLFISTARWSRSSSVSKFYDNLPLILKIPSRHLSVPNGPSGSSMVPLDPQMVPDSPRESQTIIQVSDKFTSFTIFRMDIDHLLAPPGDLGIVAFLNFMIISPLSSKSHPIHM